MSNLIVIGILAILLGAAITYIVRAKKRGVKCIGCPAAGTCSHAHKENGDPESSCGCGCHPQSK
ncbi:FeoB-associated Cys-rich membrane protein [Clostridiales bacterium]|nr:FeoB-associated Cys-rich membrane protein [Clostridiales bacterium]